MYRSLMSEDGEGMPTWVKVVGAITFLLIGAFVVVALTGAGPDDHGPGRHAMMDNAGTTGDSTDALAVCRAQGFEHGSGSVVDLALEIQAFCST